MTLEKLGNLIVADIDNVVEKYKREWLIDISYDIDIQFAPLKNDMVS